MDQKKNKGYDQPYHWECVEDALEEWFQIGSRNSAQNWLDLDVILSLSPAKQGLHHVAKQAGIRKVLPHRDRETLFGSSTQPRHIGSQRRMSVLLRIWLSLSPLLLAEPVALSV